MRIGTKLLALVFDVSSSGCGRLIPASFSRVGVEMPIWWSVGIVMEDYKVSNAEETN